MHKVYELKEKLCKELEEYGAKEKLDLTSVDIVDKLAHAIKNIDKILARYEEENGYSENGGGRYSYESGRRMMYPDYSMNRGGSYARGRGRYANRDSAGRYSSNGSYRYSRDGGYSRAEEEMDSMVNDLQDIMQDLPPDKQHEVRKFIQNLDMM